jgi:hypothetical protein
MDHDLPLYGLGIAACPAPGSTTPRPIVAVAVADGRTDRVFTGAEAFLLARLDEFLADQAPGVLATWGRPDDDLAHLADRAHRLRVGVGLQVRTGAASARRATWHHHTHLDAGLAPLRRDDATDPDSLTDRAAREARLVRRLVAARRAAAEADRPGGSPPPLPCDRDDHGPRGAAVG